MTFVLHKLLCHCLQKIDHENGPLCQKASLPLWMCRCLDDLQESSLSHRGCPVLKEEVSLEGREPYREENVSTLKKNWAIIPTFLGELELDRPLHLCGPWDIQFSLVSFWAQGLHEKMSCNSGMLTCYSWRMLSIREQEPSRDASHGRGQAGKQLPQPNRWNFYHPFNALIWFL